MDASDVATIIIASSFGVGFVVLVVGFIHIMWRDLE